MNSSSQCVSEQDQDECLDLIGEYERVDFIGALPPELSMHIISFLQPYEVANVVLTCTQWHARARDEIFWMNVVDEHYPNLASSIILSGGFKGNLYCIKNSTPRSPIQDSENSEALQRNWKNFFIYLRNFCLDPDHILQFQDLLQLLFIVEDEALLRYFASQTPDHIAMFNVLARESLERRNVKMLKTLLSSNCFVDSEILNAVSMQFADDFPSIEMEYFDRKFLIPSCVSCLRVVQQTDSLSKFHQLQTVVLTGVVGEISSTICSFLNLKTLVIALPRLLHVPNELSNLTSLSELHIVSCKRIDRIPLSICSLRNLKVLRINKTQISTLPSDFGNLSSLEKLDLDGNVLSCLPDSFGRLRSLTALSIVGNALLELPDSFGNLSSLKFLNLSSNNLLVLRSLSVQGLNELEYLDVSHNPEFMDFPLLDISPLGALKRLSYLNLQETQIKTVPEMGDVLIEV